MLLLFRFQHPHSVLAEFRRLIELVNIDDNVWWRSTELFSFWLSARSDLNDRYLFDILKRFIAI